MSKWSEEATNQPSETDVGQELITIIVPTRNEADNIEPLLDKLSDHVMALAVEVLFVDDSRDDTAQVISSLTDQYPFPIRLIARPAEKRNGLSGAVVDGLKSGNGVWACVMDADLQHPPETIPRLWEKAQRTGADMVVGSRRGDLVGPLGLTKMRSLTSKTLTILARMLFPRLLRNVSDPLTGLFLVRRDKVDLDVLRPDGFKILLEILVRCPDLHVAEIHFDFAPRHEGQSKADVREGVRFFRHVVRLRITVNPHLIRFIITILTGFIGNSLLLWLLVDKGDVPIILSGLLATEALVLWDVILFDRWVFRERNLQRPTRPIWKSFLLAQFVLALIYLPLLLWLVTLLGIHYLAANAISVMIMGLLLYGLSEQWVWTRGSMVWQPNTYIYRIHDILTIESQVKLLELQYFAVETADNEVDIQIRVDRQGTPSHLPGGISYDERLGRFGFGLTVLPGEYVQIVVSPLLERSPGFLFTNIVEPILRWSLVPKGYAMVKAASVSLGKAAVLVHAEQDLGGVTSVLCRQHGYLFMADDLSIVDQVGNVYSYPKPVTINQRMLRDGGLRPELRSRLAQAGQSLLYTRFARRLGLWLSDRNLPAATANTYLQWLVPQRKEMLGDVIPEIEYGEKASCMSIFAEGDGTEETVEDSGATMIKVLQLGKESAGFQPHPLLASRLRYWQNIDLMEKEHATIKRTVDASTLGWFSSGEGDRDHELANHVSEKFLGHDSGAVSESGRRQVNQYSDFQEEPNR